MRVTTLGTGTIALSPTRACAGYLVQAGEVALLIDCGSGVVRRLAELALPWQTITHVALSHFHIDHHGDLPTLIFAWRYGMLPARSAPLEVIGPPGTRALLDALAGAYGSWVLDPGFPLTVRELDGSASWDLDSTVRLRATKVPHTAESVAYSIEHAGSRIVYTGDIGVQAVGESGDGSAVQDGGGLAGQASGTVSFADWARGADVLICECSLPPAMAIKEHLTPEQCGMLAARAGPRRLVLTHFYPPVEREDIRAAVASHFGGAVTLAHDGWYLDLEEG